MSLNIEIQDNAKPFDYLSSALNLIDRYNKGYELNQKVYDLIALTLGSLLSAVQDSPEAKALYDSYLNLFELAASDFANGMTTLNSRILQGLRTKYMSDILRLDEARKSMLKIAEMRRLLYESGKGGDMLYEDLGNLDTFVKDPTRVPKSYNGLNITANIASKVKTVANGLYALAKGQPIDLFTDTYLSLRGFTLKDIVKAIEDIRAGKPLENNIILLLIVNDELASTGIDKWANDYDKSRALLYALNGLYAGVSQFDIKPTENYQARKDYENQQAINRMLLENELKLSSSNKLTSEKDSDLWKVKDTISLGGDRADAESVVKRSMLRLGILKGYGKNGAIFNNITLYTPGNDVFHGSRFSVRVFDKKGYLLKESEFVALGKNKAEKETLRNYYRNAIIPSIDNIGAKGSYAAGTLWNKGLLYIHNNGATYTNVLHIPTSASRDKLLSYILRIMNNSTLMEITDARNPNKGKPVKSFNDLGIDSDTPINFWLSFNNSNKGVIILIGDKRYFIPKEKMSKEDLAIFDLTNPEKIQQAELARNQRISNIMSNNSLTNELKLKLVMQTQLQYELIVKNLGNAAIIGWYNRAFGQYTGGTHNINGEAE